MGTVTTIYDVLVEIRRMADDLAGDGTINFTNNMREGLDLVIDFVEAGGSAEDFSSAQLAKVRAVVDTIAVAAASAAIVFVVGATGAVAVATAGGVTLVGVLVGEGVSILLSGFRGHACSRPY
jgi:hypothetical protein